MMNTQPVPQPKSVANGYSRRRGDREGGTRLDNKLQSGKSNSSKVPSIGAMTGSKFGGFETNDRLSYIMTCLVGLPVEVHVKNGSIYSGIFHAKSNDKEFGVVLKMARLIKDGTLRGQKAIAESVSKAPSKTLIIPGSELVEVVAKEVAVTRDGLANDLHRDRQHELMLDSAISYSRHVEMGRELERWMPDEDDPRLPELENIFDGPWHRKWDQFETNETLFGVKTTFDEELYTTKLLRGPETRELEREAMRIAREIEGEDTQDLHLAEERGMDFYENFDIDEETRFSSVYRGRNVDDSGYEEDEDIVLDSRNDETFGVSGPVSDISADLTGGKSNDGARLSSSSSLLDEAQPSQSSNGADLYRPVSHDHARQMLSEIPVKSVSTLDGENRVRENLPGEDGGNSNSKGLVDKQPQLQEDAQLSKSGDLQSREIDGSEKAGLSAGASSYAPSSASSQGNEKTSSSGEQLEVPLPCKAQGETQSVVSRGRPASSASSSSDCPGAATASNAPGLSPSSSVGSLSSEKSSLNPHAKEFKLNPNARSFVPSQPTPRPLSPAADGSFYHATGISGAPHMHGVPMSFGLGHSFAGQPPVIYNQQVPPMPSPQAYYPHGPQVLISQPRQPFYMLSYQPGMTGNLVGHSAYNIRGNSAL